ncbi:flagellar hook-associated protein FlgK [Citreimonas sp.]|uniref:flagellar hook-associated protein FlgK n=1 Tax=Citreimonas sp. TaxID=3036715 RepID=UPI0035C7A1FF
MSLSGALYNAFSGLRANTRAANVVSTNISNATTESYGRRSLELSPGAAGTSGGVRIDGVVRNVDPVILADRRLSDASHGYGNSLYAFSTRFEAAVGDSDTPGSLISRTLAFENALLTAASNPASTQRLEIVAESADALADKLNVLSDGIQEARETADRTIGMQVDRINDTMRSLERINERVRKAFNSGGDASSLLDERQRLLDGISEIVPLRVVQREQGQISVYTRGGATLLEMSASEIGFTRTAFITPDMGLGTGLSGLTLDGEPIVSTDRGMFAGGDMAAQFEIRDRLAPARQAELDGLASELMQRLDGITADASLVAGDAGLFRDINGGLSAGLNPAAFDPANEVGAAQRIRLNTDQVAPGAGNSWRLRDGMYAGTAGNVGDATLIQAIANALTDIAPPATTAFGTKPTSLTGLFGDFTGSVAGGRVSAENELSFLVSQQTAMKELELNQGVDTDAELQRLMQIEQNYAANAKVMSTVDELMERLLSI